MDSNMIVDFIYDGRDNNEMAFKRQNGVWFIIHLENFWG